MASEFAGRKRGVATRIISLALAATMAVSRVRADQVSESHSVFFSPSGALAGVSVDAVSDMDGDGYTEVAAGDPFNNAVTVWSGRTGEVFHTWSVFIGGSYFGNSIAAVGDLDSDGVSDLLVGANQMLAPGNGEATVYSGATGASLWTMSVGTGNALFGDTVDGVGDIDADGVVDWIIGSPNDQPFGWTAPVGFAYVISGASGAIVHALQTPLSTTTSKSGLGVCGIGDVDSDGRDDVAYSAIDEFSVEHVVVAAGRTGTPLHFLSAPGAMYASFGSQTGLAAAGDFDGDGIGDIVVGARNFGVDHSGAAFIYSGATGAGISQLLGTTFSGAEFGAAVCSAGDLNGDGLSEVWVSDNTAHNPLGTGTAGVVRAFTAATASVVRTHWGPSGARVGTSVANLGDFDHDGIPDVIAGSVIGDPAELPAVLGTHAFVADCGDVTEVGAGCKKGVVPAPTLEWIQGCFTVGGTIAIRMKIGPSQSNALLAIGLPGASTPIPGSGGCLLHMGTPVLFLPVFLPYAATVDVAAKLPWTPWTNDLVVQLLCPITHFGVPALIASKGLRFSPP